MRGRKIKCPACGEPMTVAGDPAARVSCPHCRSVVSLPAGADHAPADASTLEFPAGPPDVEKARDFLEQILQQTRLRQAALERAAAELKMLQARAGSLRQWLEGSAGGDSSQWSRLLFQSRLLTRLAAAPKGFLQIVETSGAEEDSFGSLVRDTFQAVGWQVDLDREPGPARRDRWPVFSVGAGPMSGPVATAHLALTLAGLPLRSVIDHDQPDHAILILHGVVPPLLSQPIPASPTAQPAAKFFQEKPPVSTEAAAARLLAV